MTTSATTTGTNADTNADTLHRASTPPSRPQQTAALAALARTFATHDRAQLLMACGTGKTLVGRWHAQATHAGRVLVVLPSLALLTQTVQEWRRYGDWSFDTLIVCSDPSTAAGTAEREDVDRGDFSAVLPPAIRPAVTTNPAIAARFLRTHRPNRPQVIFSTYHSAHVVAEAQDLASDTAFDLVILDEAHRLAGRGTSDFRVVLDEHALHARHRLFMTATRLIVDRANLPAEDLDEVLSMDQEHVFGPVAHVVDFAEAIAAGQLCDYRVVVVARPTSSTDDSGNVAHPEHVEVAETTHLHHEASTTAAALAGAIDEHGLRRILTFHGRTAKAETFAAVVHGASTPGGVRIHAQAVDAQTPATSRAAALRWLAAPTPGSSDAGAVSQARVISSVRCLTEGIDVPAVDAVVFSGPRSSAVDVIQAVGRALRTAPGKDRGTIVLPVELPAHGDDDTWLTTSAWDTVWTVLRTLRAMDGRLDLAFTSAVRRQAEKRRPASRRRLVPDCIEFDLPLGLDFEALQVRLVDEVGTGWERFYALAQVWAGENPDRCIPDALVWRGHSMGQWVKRQRLARRRGLLSADRIRRLEELPKWVWDRSDAEFRATLPVLVSISGTTGLDSPTSTSSPYTGRRAATKPPVQLGVWVARQRQAWRDGGLAPERQALLEAVPGWRWTVLPERDRLMVDALKVFVEFEKHAAVPATYVEGRLPLGQWVWDVRRRHLTETLHPSLREEISAVAGNRWTSTGGGFDWCIAETRWRLCFTALRQFAQREGKAMPPNGHREVLPDITINLYQWVSLQRHLRRKGELDPVHERALAALPGWLWDSPHGGRREFGEPIDLGGHPHGTAKGRAAKCPCEKCLGSRREYDVQRLAAARRLKDPVPATPVRDHLRQVEEQVKQLLRRTGSDNNRSGRTSIAVVAGVPLAAVRRALSDAEDLERAHATALLQVTAAAVVEASAGQAGSRGRRISTHQERVPAAPTHAALARMAVRGFGASWISREAGFKVTVSGNTVTRRVADVVADLVAAVGTLRWDGPPNSRVPPLAQLRAEHAARQVSTADERKAS